MDRMMSKLISSILSMAVVKTDRVEKARQKLADSQKDLDAAVTAESLLLDRLTKAIEDLGLDPGVYHMESGIKDKLIVIAIGKNEAINIYTSNPLPKDDNA
jgi:DNA anti-recombination protein RmuC